jgi:hypothetical protein
MASSFLDMLDDPPSSTTPPPDTTFPMSTKAPQDFGHPLVLDDYIPIEPPVTNLSPPLCATCHSVVSTWQRCAACKIIRYCDRTCQAHDWATHKAVCRQFSDFSGEKVEMARTEAAKVSTEYKLRRALLFEPGGKTRFTWLKFGKDNTIIPTPARPDNKTIAFHNRYLPYWIQLVYDGNPEGKRYMEFNQAIGGGFRGTVIAVAYDAEEGLSAPPLDIDTTALGPILEYARLRKEYGGPVFVEQPQERYTEEQWGEIRGKSNQQW